MGVKSQSIYLDFFFKGPSREVSLQREADKSGYSDEGAAHGQARITRD